jgi:hypothetical protein
MKRKRDINKELFDAISVPDQVRVTTLLTEGADPNALGEQASPLRGHRNALWFTTENAVDEISDERRNFSRDLSEAFNLPKRNHEGRRLALMNIIRALLAAGARLDVHCFGGTPLRIAVAQGDRELVELFLSHGADPDAKTYSPFSKTAKTERIKSPLGYMGYSTQILHEAAEKGSREIVELLLKAGADPSAVDQDGKTPLQIAREKGHIELISLLKTPSGDNS